MVERESRSLLDHPSLWRGEELVGRTDWQILLTGVEIEELQTAAERLLQQPVESIEPAGIELPLLGPRLEQIGHDLEHGCGAAWLRGTDKETEKDKTKGNEKKKKLIMTRP